MKEYATPAIRNVAVVGHGGSGKTSLVDALAFVAGSSKRHGRIKEGSALTDYSPDEVGYLEQPSKAFLESVVLHDGLYRGGGEQQDDSRNDHQRVECPEAPV